MGGDAEEKKKKGRQGVQDLNLECSILFEGVEYIYIYIYNYFFLHFFKFEHPEQQVTRPLIGRVGFES